VGRARRDPRGGPGAVRGRHGPAARPAAAAQDVLRPGLPVGRRRVRPLSAGAAPARAVAAALARSPSQALLLPPARSFPAGGESGALPSPFGSAASLPPSAAVVGSQGKVKK